MKLIQLSILLLSFLLKSMEHPAPHPNVNNPMKYNLYKAVIEKRIADGTRGDALDYRLTKKKRELYRPSIECINNNYLDLLELLLKNNLNPNNDAEDETPLVAAATKLNFDAVKLLITYNANVHQTRGLYKENALHRLCSDRTDHDENLLQQCQKMLTFLIQKGANINDQDGFGYTPLMWLAASERIPNTVQLALAQTLLGKGANISKKAATSMQFHNETALGIALLLGKDELAKLIADYQHREQREYQLNNDVEDHAVHHQDKKQRKAIDAEPECPICLVSLDNTTETLETTCKHIFCRACLLEWLKEHNSCPLCRTAQ